MDALPHHTRLLAPGHYLSRWHLGEITLEARWQPPLQLLSVTLADSRHETVTDDSLPGNPYQMTMLAWLSCEKASRELALDDPLQAELAMAIVALKAESLRMAGFQDTRHAGGDNVTPLRGPTYSMN